MSKNKLYPMLFTPIYKEVVWGGNIMADKLERELPKTEVPIGEAWEIVDRDDAMSIVENGDLKGETLRNLVEKYGKKLIGSDFNGKVFPLLVKIIDAEQDLSLQVHPDDAACAELGNGAEPKTEMWYLIDKQPGAEIIAGLEQRATKSNFIANLDSPNVKESLQIYPSKAGDSYFIKSGLIHAIGGGNLLLEVQQNSNTTYRVSDWGRLGVDGKPREIHVEQAIKSIDFMDRTTSRIPGVSDLADRNRKFALINKCPFFTVDDLKLTDSWNDNTNSTKSMHILSAINNKIIISNDNIEVVVPKGRTCLVPADFGQYKISLPNGNTTVIKTTL